MDKIIRNNHIGVGMFSFDQLRYFVETARVEHVGKAAKSLGVSPSTLSQSIANLEAAVGQALFYRAGKAIHLSSAGHAFAKRAEELIKAAVRLEADFRADEGEPAGMLRMAATHSLAVGMARVWVKISEVYPKLLGDIRSTSSADVTAGVLRYEADFGLRYGVAPEAEELAQFEVQAGSLAVCVRKDHPLLRIPIAGRFDKLKGYPLAMPRSFSPKDEDASSPIVSVMRSELPDLVFDSYDVSTAYILRTDAWGVYPLWLFQQLSEQLREIEPPKIIPAAGVYATWRKDSRFAKRLEGLALQLRTSLSGKGRKWL